MLYPETSMLHVNFTSKESLFVKSLFVLCYSIHYLEYLLSSFREKICSKPKALPVTKCVAQSFQFVETSETPSITLATLMPQFFTPLRIKFVDAAYLLFNHYYDYTGKIRPQELSYRVNLFSALIHLSTLSCE